MTSGRSEPRSRRTSRRAEARHGRARHPRRDSRARTHGNAARALVSAKDLHRLASRVEDYVAFRARGHVLFEAHLQVGVDRVVQIIRERCRSRTEQVSPFPPVVEPGEVYMPYPMEVEVGGATVFVVDVERFEKC